jgi:hypothetical protein
MGSAEWLELPDGLQRGRRILCGLLLLAVPMQGGYAQLPSTAAEKAVFVRNLVSFVKWPQESAGTGGDSFQFCVERDAFLAFALSKELKTVRVGEQKVVVRLLSRKSDFRDCQAVIFANVDQRHVEIALQEMHGRKVLTVGETEGFLKAGGVVQLNRGRIGWEFEVNLDAAGKAQLKFDTRLLQMAKSVIKNGDSLTD